MTRINWIDWTKAAAVCTVVFCHLPQPSDFYMRYLQAGIITIFFFLSGYLKKDRGSMAANWKKYWRGLILPYLLYNLLFLPYWIVRFYMEQGMMPTGADVMRPIIGALLAEHHASFCEPLNGPLWYLPAILFLHILTDLLHKLRHRYLLIAVLCIASFFLYYAYRYYGWHKSMTPMGIVRRLPYYYLGYVMGRYQLLHGIRTGERSPVSYLIACIGCLLLGILFFHWHIHESRLFLHIALFYPFNVCFLFTAIFGCKVMDRYAPQWMVNLSVGTLVVIGLHWIVMGCVNHILLPLFDIDWFLYMTWYQAILVTLFIVILIYPVIVLGRRYFPILLGR